MWDTGTGPFVSALFEDSKITGSNPGGPYRCVQPTVCGPHAAQDGYEYGPTQHHKFT